MGETHKKVYDLRAMGVEPEHIAVALGISIQTARQYSLRADFARSTSPEERWLYIHDETNPRAVERQRFEQFCRGAGIEIKEPEEALEQSTSTTEERGTAETERLLNEIIDRLATLTEILTQWADISIKQSTEISNIRGDISRVVGEQKNTQTQITEMSGAVSRVLNTDTDLLNDTLNKITGYAESTNAIVKRMGKR